MRGEAAVLLASPAAPRRREPEGRRGCFIALYASLEGTDSGCGFLTSVDFCSTSCEEEMSPKYEVELRKKES